MTLEECRTAIRGVCEEKNLDVRKYVTMLEEFWKECPESLAALDYVTWEMAMEVGTLQCTKVVTTKARTGTGVL